ncbi:hypothetical protein KPL28_02510 [Clostridium algidicarnis]|uniref:hypothetical protein n=1 Tax=Clostridium algidicarnis TaxID=37659 RepID=UPI001C0AF04E|nr:hypothetical protein [Clostridium algidicarnis]MBU3208505.1 hypothetical protein [Clostridium algidicarnis]
MANGNFAGGSGTELSPYLIEDAHDLNAVRKGLNKCYKLVKDIDLDVNPFNIGEGWKPIGGVDNAFTGVFDGSNHVIQNLYINKTDINDAGFFGVLYCCKIINLGLINTNITAKEYVGGIAGRCIINNNKDYIIIDHCYVIGNIIASLGCCGGLIGTSNGYTFDSVIIKNCYSKGTVSSNSNEVGGISGKLHSSTILNCFSDCNIQANAYAGGLSGSINAYCCITNCYVKGDSIKASVIAGGLTGSANVQNIIKNSFSISNILCLDRPGGIMGDTPNLLKQTFTNSYWDVETSNQTISKGGTGKTTLEMKTPSTFIDWDKEKLENGKGVWILQDGQYPKLWFEKPPAKHLFKQNNQYYSIKSELYNDSKFQPITELQGKSSLSKDDYNNFGIDDLNILTQNMTVGTETFRPIDKFTGEIEIYKYTEK